MILLKPVTHQICNAGAAMPNCWRVVWWVMQSFSYQGHGSSSSDFLLPLSSISWMNLFKSPNVFTFLFAKLESRICNVTHLIRLWQRLNGQVVTEPWRLASLRFLLLFCFLIFKYYSYYRHYWCFSKSYPSFSFIVFLARNILTDRFCFEGMLD